MCQCQVIERALRRMSGQRFKVLLDLLASSPDPVWVYERPYRFRQRQHWREQVRYDDRAEVRDVGSLLRKASPWWCRQCRRSLLCRDFEPSVVAGRAGRGWFGPELRDVLGFHLASPIGWATSPKRLVR